MDQDFSLAGSTTKKRGGGPALQDALALAMCLRTSARFWTAPPLRRFSEVIGNDGRASVSSPRRVARVLQPVLRFTKPQPGALWTGTPYPPFLRVDANNGLAKLDRVISLQSNCHRISPHL